MLVQTVNRLKYVDPKGKEHIEFRKAWVGDKLDMIMANFKEEAPVTKETNEETEE